jgi:hypothetical protein
MPVMPLSTILRSITRTLLWCTLVLAALPSITMATPYFEDGFLGLSQQELHEKLGRPQAVRDRKSALRVFTYYPITDWATYFSKLVSPENGEDVYTVTREGMEIRYSFSYAVDPNDHDDNRPLIVRLVDIEFPHPVPISRLNRAHESHLSIQYLGVAVPRTCFIGRPLHCEGSGQGSI